jgi:uncharacterized protein
MPCGIFKVFYILQPMFDRQGLRNQLAFALENWRGVVLVGPRQIGKTTLARQFVAESSANYFDLEKSLDRDRLRDPFLTLSDLQGLIVIDEVQLAPGLFPALRVLMDRTDQGPNSQRGQFLLLGSASPALLRQSGESLLGRVLTIEVSGFGVHEVASQDRDRLWIRGGYPRAFTAASDDLAYQWLDAASQSYVFNDLPQLGVNVNAPAMLRFWKMLAHMHGQVWNAAHPARSLGVSESTVRRYLDYLTQSFMVRQLQPWHVNLNKRQVKSPKVYLRDSGLLHCLLGIRQPQTLLEHPMRGASWEGFALEQVIKVAQPDEAYFWATHSGAELDLLLLKGRQRVGVEFKHTDSPKVTASMRTAAEDLQLDKLYVVYPGKIRYPLAIDIEAVPLESLY